MSDIQEVIHDTFTIERDLAAPPARVFAAFSTEEAKHRWFKGPDDWEQGPSSFDFRVGGRESDVGGPRGGFTSRMELTYSDIVDDQRIVYTYEMYLDDRKMSVSVASIEFHPDGAGTRLVLTEHGVYFDGDVDGPAGRREGTEGLVDALVGYVDAPVSPSRS
jgi:uncharacterized protein YndB with AHSA1/START domain